MLPVAKPKILVVEDDDTVRRLLAEHLTERMPVEVDSSPDGIDALHKLTTTTRYRAVILDVMMPKMSGVDLLDSLCALRSDPSLSAVEIPPVIVITAAPAAALPDDAIHRRCPGAVKNVLRKPLDIAVLAASVERYLR